MLHLSRRRLMAVIFVAIGVAALVRALRGSPAPVFSIDGQPPVSDEVQPPWTGPETAPPDAPPLHDDPPT